MQQLEHPFTLLQYCVIVLWASKVLFQHLLQTVTKLSDVEMKLGGPQNNNAISEEGKRVLKLFRWGPILAMGNR